MLKAVLPALPVIGGLPGVKHAKGSVPDLVLKRSGVTTCREHLDAYNDVCGFPLGDTLPATFPHMAAFALHMSLMTDTAFPFAPMGLVHLRNSITQHRPIGVDESFDVSVCAADLRTHPKGSLVDLTEKEAATPQGRRSRSNPGSPVRCRGTRRCRALEAVGRSRPPIRSGVG